MKAFLILLVFISFEAQAGVEDLVLTEGGWIIDCSDVDANDGCYEWPECCTEEDNFKRLEVDPCIYGGDYDTCVPGEEK